MFVTGVLSALLIGCSHPPAQKYVDADAGGHRLHMLVIGDARENTPAVILESGMGGGIGWEHTRNEIARFAQVVTYERAGTGQSEPGPAPRDAKAVASELRAALHHAGVKPPYVLVGQSLGGLYVQVFAADYPQETAGLVLVDPTHADAGMCLSLDEVKRWYMSHEPDDWPRVEAILQRTAPDTIQSFLACKYKLMEEFLQTIREPRRSAMRREWWAMVDRIVGTRPLPVLNPGEREEAMALSDSIRQAMAARPLPKVPTILLAAGKTDLDTMPADALTPNVRALQAEARRWKFAAFQKWIDATPGGKLIIVKDSNHDIESDRPEAVIDAVRAVVR
jgi:pimeloyl-ACP methyl ester carboxylesterase